MEALCNLLPKEADLLGPLQQAAAQSPPLLVAHKETMAHSSRHRLCFKW